MMNSYAEAIVPCARLLKVLMGSWQKHRHEVHGQNWRERDSGNIQGCKFVELGLSGLSVLQLINE